MSEKHKNVKAKKVLLTLAATSATLAAPLATLSLNEATSDESTASAAFAADRIVQGNPEIKEYTELKNRYFGFYRKDETILTSDSERQKLAKFTKEPTLEDWNKPEQTWEIKFDSGILQGHGGYSYGQRAVGFALSNDIELIPGSITLKLDYVNSSTGGKFDYYPGYSWRNPDKKDYSSSQVGDNSLFYNDEWERQWNTRESFEGQLPKGFYLRIADKNKQFYPGSEQDFSGTNIRDYWVKNLQFDITNGSTSKGNILYDINKKPDKKLSINTFPYPYPEWNYWSGYYPRINAIEYLTTDVNKSASGLGSHIPYFMWALTTRNLAANFGFDNLNNVFGVAINKEKGESQSSFGTKIYNYLAGEYRDEASRKWNLYNQLTENTGSMFLINIDNGKENWAGQGYNEAKPAYIITMKFKTKKRYVGVLENPDNINDYATNSTITNAYLNNRHNKSFVSALYHADYYNNRFSVDNNAGANPTSNGEIGNMFSAEATSFAVRSKKRHIQFNITENLRRRDGKDDKFPQIDGYNVYKGDQLIDTVKVSWDDTKNNALYLGRGKFNTTLNVNLDTTNLRDINDLNNITIKPYYSDSNSSRAQSLFKYNVSGQKFSFDINTGILRGSLEYSISEEQKAKEALEQELSRSKLDSNLLYEDTPLTSVQQASIKAAIGFDYDRKRFGGSTTPSTTRYNGFWKDFIKQISKANKDKLQLSQANTDVKNSVNFRLSSNKATVESLINEIETLKKNDIDSFKIGISHPDNEVYFVNGLDPRKVDFKGKIEQFNKEVAKMNGQSTYNQIVSDIDAKIAKYESTNDLYKLAKYLNNSKAQSNAALIELQALKDNWAKLKDYLRDTVVFENLTDFKTQLETYVNNYANNSVLEKLAALAGNGIQNALVQQFLKPFALSGKNQNSEINSELKNGFVEILNQLDINKLSKALTSNENQSQKTQLTNALFMEKFYDDFAKISNLNTNNKAINSLEYTLSQDAKNYISRHANSLVPNNNVFEFIKGKNAATKALSSQINTLLTNKNFDYWDRVQTFVSQVLPSNTVNAQEVSNLFAPLKLVVEKINNFENVIALADSGFSDVLYAYAFNDWLLNNNKYYLLDQNDKNAVKTKMNSLMTEIAEMLKVQATPEALKAKSLASNEQYLETILKAKIQLKDSKTVADNLVKTTNTQPIKSTQDLANLIENNIQYQALKLAATKAKNKLNTEYSNIKNEALLAKFKKAVDDSVVKYDLTATRVAADQGDAFYKTNQTVKSDWDTFGNFYALNNLTRENYAKEINNLKTASDAYVDQFYKNELDKLTELNTAIASLITKISQSQLSEQNKEFLNNLAKKSADVNEVNNIEQQLAGLSNKFNQVDSLVRETNQTIQANDVNYKFASQTPKNQFNSILTSVPKVKGIIAAKEITTLKDLGELSKQLDSVIQSINNKKAALDGERQLNNLKNQVTASALPSFSDTHIGYLKDALNNANDLADASAKVEQYKELNSTIASAKELESKISETKAKSKYIDATDSLKKAYDLSAEKLQDALKTYSPKIEKYKESNPTTWTNNLPTLKEEIKQIADKYQADLKALDGDSLLTQARAKAQQALNQATNLSPETKKALQSQITSAKDANSLKNLTDKISNLDNAIHGLIEKINSTELSSANKDVLKNLAKKISDISEVKPFEDKIDALKAKYDEINNLTKHVDKVIADNEPNYQFASKDPKDKFTALSTSLPRAKQLLSDRKIADTSKEVAFSDLDTLSKQFDIFIKDAQKKEAALDGKTQFAKAKEDASNAIEQLQNLDQEAKQAAKDAIKQAANTQDIDDIVAKETALNSVIGEANDALTQAKAQKETPQYKQAADDKQATFDNAIEDLEQFIATAKAQSNLEKVQSNIEELNSKKDALTAAQRELDGDAKVAAAIEVAKAVIDNLDSIDTPVKDFFKEQLQGKTSIKEIENITDNAKATNEASRELVKKVKKAEELKKSPEYNFIQPDKVEALENMIKAGKDLLTATGDKLKEATLVENINRATENLSQAIVKASSQADSILSAQTTAQNEIDKLPHLTNQQKEALKREVSSTLTQEDIDAVVAKAKELDKYTDAYKTAIDQAKALDKQADKYKYADDSKRQEFDDELKDAEVALAAGLADKTKEQIEQLTNKLKNAQEALNGDNKLADAKTKAQEKVQALEKLSQEQKNVIKDAISKATTPEAINTLAQKAEELNDALANAKNVLEAANETKTQPQFTEASEQPSQAFQAAVNKLQQDITNASGTDLDSSEKLDNLINALKADITKTNETTKALDGTNRLDQAKAEANGLITAANNLSQAAKDALKDKVNSATTIAGVQAQKDATNNAQEAAKELIDNLEKVNNALQAAGSSLDNAIVSEATKAKEQAQKFLDQDNKLKSDADIAAVTSASQQLAEVLAKIKANANALQDAKIQALEAIKQLPNLSQTQKDALSNAVKAGENTTKVNEALTKANELNNIIGQLNNNLASLEKQKESVNYKAADQDKQAQLNNVANDEGNIKHQAAVTLDKDTIQALNDRISQAKDALNGNANVQAAKDEVAQLNNITAEQKEAANKLLDQVQSKEDLTNTLEKVKNFDSNRAKVTQAQTDLDALIKQFTKPQNLNDTQLSEFTSFVQQANTVKEELLTAKAAATSAHDATSELNFDAIKEALSQVQAAKTTAASALETINVANQAIVTEANIANFTQDNDKATATQASQKALDKTANVFESLSNARQVQHLAALDKLAKFKENLPQELKDSAAFALTLNGASEDLQASSTKASDDAILAKVQHQLDKAKLAKAYDAVTAAVISDQMPESLKQELEAEKQKALNMLQYANTDVNTPKATYDAQADKLNVLLAKNDLAAAIANASNAPKSEQLTAAISQANEALNNASLDQEAIKQALDKLVNETNKAKLYEAIKNANAFVKELQEGNKDLHSNLRDQILNKLTTQDIPTAQQAAEAQNNAAGYNMAAAALDNAVSQAKKTIADVYKALEELRSKITNMPEAGKSAQLQAAYEDTKDINQNSGAVEIENALDKLQHKYLTNELDKAIASAPVINDKYAALVPSITNESETISNNSHASEAEVKSQLEKQLLNNAKGNALNTLPGLNNLNTDQAKALANLMAQANNDEQLAKVQTQAQELNKAMGELKETYAKVEPAYTTGNNLPYEFFLTPANKQEFIKDTIAKAGNIIPANGEIYLDNLPAQVVALNNDLKNALDLLGAAKGKAASMQEEFAQLKNKANSIQVNEDKLFNSPKALQEKLATTKAQITELSDKFENDHAAYMQAGNTKMQELVDQLSDLNKQVEQFSAEVFMKDNARITQAQNTINSNSEYLNNNVAKETLAAFDSATTFAQANEALASQINTNNDIKAKIDKLVANLTDSLTTNTSHPDNNQLMAQIAFKAKEEIVTQLENMKMATENAILIRDNLNGLLNNNNLDKSFNTELENVLLAANNFPATRFDSYPEFNTALENASEQNKNHVNGINLLVSAVKTRNADQLAEAITLLEQTDKKNAKLAKLMQENNYLGILTDADQKAVTKDQLATVAAMKDSEQYQNASPAVQALLREDLSGKKPWIWWPIAVTVSAIAWVAGMLAILLKRK
ncbi:hypothetical protein [Mycoplasma sp. Sp33II]|uniref:hypothetical protein n=1 Tax=unclassified Mycoplasma TaxID=2683645 RepID=UPI003AADA551